MNFLNRQKENDVAVVIPDAKAQIYCKNTKIRRDILLYSAEILEKQVHLLTHNNKKSIMLKR